jgi:hypothetical protein
MVFGVCFKWITTVISVLFMDKKGLNLFEVLYGDPFRMTNLEDIFLILKNIELPAATLAPIGTTSFLVAAGAKRRP